MIPIFFLIPLLIAGVDTPDEMILATNDWHGTRLVPIYYVDQPVSSTGYEVLGLYNPNTDVIEIKEGWAFTWARNGGTIRDHEILHAWGYDHYEMHLNFEVDSPYEDVKYGTYDPENIHHWDPNYIWEGYGNG